MVTCYMDRNENAMLDIKLSFIIPAYNSFEHIDQCIGSIYRCCINCSVPTEIIIIDDGSSDIISAKLDSYCHRMHWDEASHLHCNNVRFIICHTVNKGVSCARNSGLKIASGQYVIFVDSDDTIDSQKMLECINTMLDDDKIDMMIYGMSFDYYRRGKCYRTNLAVPPYKGVRTKKECVGDIDILFDANSLSSLCNRIIKREIINGIYLCESLLVYEDLEFSLRAFANCRYVFFYNKPVYHYRQSEVETHTVNRIKNISNIQYIVDKIEAALPMSADDKEHILNSLFSHLTVEKIKGVYRHQIKDICDEYKSWIDSKGYKTKNSLIYSGNVNKIYYHLYISRIRHRIADYVKAMK